MEDFMLDEFEQKKKEERAKQISDYDCYKNFLHDYVGIYKRNFNLTESEAQKVERDILNDDYVYETLSQAVLDTLDGMNLLPF